jgi:glycosyltransferase involved in cell wall biosynthesis
MSVLMQDTLDGEMEVICVDDGSTDETVSEIETIAAKDTRVKLYRQQHQGPYIARDLGLSKAQGLYIHYMDSDDMLEQNTYSICLGLMQFHELDQILFCGEAFGKNKEAVENYNRHYSVSDELKGNIYSGIELVEKMSETGNFFVGLPFRIVKRELVQAQEIPPCLCLFHADNYYSMATLCLSRKSMVIGNRLYKRRVREGSISTTPNIEKEHFTSIWAVIFSLSYIFSTTLNHINRPFINKYMLRMIRALYKRAGNLTKDEMENCIDTLDLNMSGEIKFFLKTCFLPLLMKEWEVQKRKKKK